MVIAATQLTGGERLLVAVGRDHDAEPPPPTRSMRARTDTPRHSVGAVMLPN